MLESLRRILPGLGKPSRGDGGFAAQLMGQQPASVWCLDNLRTGGGRLELDGWGLAPGERKPAIAVNGVRLEANFGSPRTDLADLMAFDRRAPTAGFQARHADLAALGAAREHLEIQFCDAATLRPFNEGHSFFWPLNPLLHPFPDPERRRRVHGDANEDGFIINGYSTFMKLSRALGKLSLNWRSFGNILDWGCGCGRVFRYLPPEALGRLTGVDIDADNVAWCARSFTTSRFLSVPLLPPTSLPDGHFDLVLGISVFTHLNEQPQKAWLAELARITRKGALLLVTIHGPAAGGRANISEEQFRGWMETGFVSTGQSVDLKGVIADESYYVNAMHTHDYVRREWGRHFKVESIVDSTIANHQDLVVMRRR